MKRILPVAAAFAAIGCALSAAPALASQPGAAQPVAVAAAHPGHAVAAPDSALSEGCNVQNCSLYAADGLPFYWNDNPYPVFMTPVIGHVVDQNGSCWPFLQCGFDARYSGKEVLEFVSQFTGGCMETDSVHSDVGLATCVAHDAGDYWVAVGNGAGRGACPTNALWLVNVGFTNHYLTYPNAAAMQIQQTPKGPVENVSKNLTISNDDQWCLLT